MKPWMPSRDERHGENGMGSVGKDDETVKGRIGCYRIKDGTRQS